MPSSKRPRLNLTESQIIYLWKHAENPSKQLKVLADLNATSEKVIRQVLQENGVSLKAKKPPKRKKQGWLN